MRILVSIGKRGKRSPAARRKQAMQMRIPDIEQLQELRPLTRARIQIEPCRNRGGNAQVGSRRPAIGCRRERIANGLQRALLTRRENHRGLPV